MSAARRRAALPSRLRHYAKMQAKVRNESSCGCTRCVRFFTVEFFIVGTEKQPGCGCCRCAAERS